VHIQLRHIFKILPTVATNPEGFMFLIRLKTSRILDLLYARSYVRVKHLPDSEAWKFEEALLNSRIIIAIYHSFQMKRFVIQCSVGIQNKSVGRDLNSMLIFSYLLFYFSYLLLLLLLQNLLCSVGIQDRETRNFSISFFHLISGKCPQE